MAKHEHGNNKVDYILDSTVVDPSGKVLYTLSSDPKRKKWTKICDETGMEVAHLDWDHMFSPRMTFQGGNKVKCKEFVPFQDKEKTCVNLVVMTRHYSLSPANSKRWLLAGQTANVYEWAPGEEDKHDMVRSMCSSQILH